MRDPSPCGTAGACLMFPISIFDFCLLHSLEIVDTYVIWRKRERDIFLMSRWETCNHCFNTEESEQTCYHYSACYIP